MLWHDEVRSPTNVDHPSGSTDKHGDGGFADTSQVAGSYQQITEDKQQYDD